MTKYQARHKCKGHRWSEYHSWYEVHVGFWRAYRCLRCSELKDTLDPIPDYKYKEESW